MEVGYKQIGIQELDDLIKRRRIGLPDFQRSYDWQPDDVVNLLTTVFRRWPSGTLLLLESNSELANKIAIRAIEGGPPIDDTAKLDYLILDGQQRITSLYRAVTGNDPEYAYYIDLERMLKINSFDDEAVKFTRREKIPEMQTAADRLVLPIDTLYDKSVYSKWLESVAETTRDRVDQFVNEHLLAIRLYSLPANTLKSDVPLGSLVRIFTRLNREGLPLETFDMLVALMTPQDFDLRGEASITEAQCGQLIIGLEGSSAEKFGVGMSVIRVITLSERNRQVVSGEGVTIEALREEDVVELVDKRPQLIASEWRAAASAFIDAIAFVRQRCGATHRNLLPPTSLLQVLATALRFETSSSEEWEDDLERWLWSAWLTGSYAQGTNTTAVSHVNQLREWANDRSLLPSVIAELAASPEQIRVNLTTSARGHKHLQTAVMAMIVDDGARDWFNGTDGTPAPELRKYGRAIEFHHVMPDKYLIDRGRSGEMVANFTPLAASTNRSLGKDSPGTVLEHVRLAPEVLSKHKINKRRFERGADGLNEFIEDRVNELLTLVANATGIGAIAAKQ